MDELESPTDVTEAPTLGASPDATGSSPEGAGSQPLGASGDVTNPPALETTSEQTVVDPLEAVLKDLPTADELKQQALAGTKYAAAVAELRPVAEQYRQLNQQIQPWQPVIDQFGKPEDLQTAIDLNSLLYGKTREQNGQMVPDLSEFVSRVATDSPHRVDQLLAEAALTTVEVPKADGTTEKITRLESLRRHMGWVPQSEAQPVGVQSPIEGLDPKYNEVFQKLAPEIQEMLTDASEVAREQYLSRELAESNRLASEAKAAEQQEQTFFQEAQLAGFEAVKTGYGDVLNSSLEDIFKDVSNDSVTLTGDKAKDTRLKGLVGAALITLTDPVKRPYVEQLLGLTVPKDLDQRADAWEVATANAVIAEKYGDVGGAKELRRQSDAAALWLKVKGIEIGAQALKNLSEILGFSYENQNKALGQATRTRPVIQGNPLNPTANQGLQIPDNVQPFSPEWNALTTAPFVR